MSYYSNRLCNLELSLWHFRRPSKVIDLEMRSPDEFVTLIFMLTHENGFVTRRPTRSDSLPSVNYSRIKPSQIPSLCAYNIHTGSTPVCLQSSRVKLEILVRLHGSIYLQMRGEGVASHIKCYTHGNSVSSELKLAYNEKRHQDEFCASYSCDLLVCEIASNQYMRAVNCQLPAYVTPSNAHSRRVFDAYVRSCSPDDCDRNSSRSRNIGVQITCSDTRITTPATDAAAAAAVDVAARIIKKITARWA